MVVVPIGEEEELECLRRGGLEKSRNRLRPRRCVIVAWDRVLLLLRRATSAALVGDFIVPVPKSYAFGVLSRAFSGGERVA